VTARQLRTLKDGLVDAFVNNAHPSRPLVITEWWTFWCDERGEVLTIDVLTSKADEMLTPASESESDSDSDVDIADGPSVENSPERKEKSVSRKTRRALVERTARILVVQSKGDRKVNLVSDGVAADSMVKAQHDINNEWPLEYKALVKRLLVKYDDLFTVESHTTTPLGQYTILTEGYPVKQRPYRLAMAEKPYVSKYIEESLTADIIRPSSSPWSSPILLVKRKDGT
jgi:hypothetical protein